MIVVVTVVSPTLNVVFVGAKSMIVSEGIVDGGNTKVHGGQQPIVGLGVTKIVLPI